MVNSREALHERIENDFMYHPPRDEEMVMAYTDLRERFKALAHVLIDTVPPGRELSLALTKLEEAVMHANSGIARGSP